MTPQERAAKLLNKSCECTSLKEVFGEETKCWVCQTAEAIEAHVQESGLIEAFDAWCAVEDEEKDEGHSFERLYQAVDGLRPSIRKT